MPSLQRLCRGKQQPLVHIRLGTNTVIISTTQKQTNRLAEENARHDLLEEEESFICHLEARCPVLVM